MKIPKEVDSFLGRVLKGTLLAKTAKQIRLCHIRTSPVCLQVFFGKKTSTYKTSPLIGRVQPSPARLQLVSRWLFAKIRNG